MEKILIRPTTARPPIAAGSIVLALDRHGNTHRGEIMGELLANSEGQECYPVRLEMDGEIYLVPLTRLSLEKLVIESRTVELAGDAGNEIGRAIGAAITGLLVGFVRGLVSIPKNAAKPSHSVRKNTEYVPEVPYFMPNKPTPKKDGATIIINGGNVQFNNCKIS